MDIIVGLEELARVCDLDLVFRVRERRLVAIP